MPQTDVEIAVLKVQIDNLNKAVLNLTAEVKALNEAMNKGKGAIALIVLVSGAIGGAITKFIGH